jgi:phosphopantothenoylcysteine decarboxylase/phosphopantothenate--cysteine ligase
MTISLLQNKQIVLGVTGSIACYKAADLASKLTQAGALVDVVLTESAARFITPLAFRSVTGRPVYTDLWDDDHVRHVRLGETADLLLIAPATAHTIAKLALGLADNLLLVTALAARCPLLIAPAMDGGMFDHPATQANLATLHQRGVTIVGPAAGRMASGLIGQGRMLEPAELLAHTRLLLGRQSGSLRGCRVVVTAGPTREAVDPVRFISNHSSGKQGIALAQAALDAGAHVTLIAGPMTEPPPIGADYIPVESAADMEAAVLSAVTQADALLMAAAVADFRPDAPAQQKLKKTEMSDKPAIHLTRNPDILSSVQAQKERIGRPLLTLGFAAETQNVLDYGRDKLQRKGLDLIVINDVSAADAGFAVDTNRVILLDAVGGVEELPLQSKTAVAEHIIQRVALVLDGHV